MATPTLKWQKGGCQTTWCRTGWYASPAVADLDGDGKTEIIWADYRIVVVKGEDGSTKWTVDDPGGGRTWPDPVVTDIDGDGGLEVVAAHGGGYVSVTRANGTAQAGWPQRVTTSELRSLAVGDVDGNGDLEIAVASTVSDNQWSLLEHTGVVRAGWPKQTDSNTLGYAAGCFNQNVGLADIDGDGRLELVGPNDTHYVSAFRDDGTAVSASRTIYGQISGQDKPWARVGFHYSHAVDLRGYANCAPGTEPLEPRPNFADSSPTFADLDGDGTLEVVIVGNQYDCRTDPYTSLFHVPYVLRGDRTRWAASGFDWTNLPVPDGAAAPLAEDYNLIETVMPNPVVADLDGDGQKEILFQSYDGRLHAYWLDKREHGAWPFAVTNSGEGVVRFGSPPAIVDLDNDGQAEVVFTTWTQKGSNAGGQLLILSASGGLLRSVDLPRVPTQSWGGAMAAPTVADIDGDGELEVVIGTAQTGLVAYDLPGTSNARVLWGTGRGGNLRSGVAPAAREAPPEPLAYRRYFAEGATIPPFDCRFALLNPGQADAATTFRFLRKDGQRLTRSVTVPARSRRTVDAKSVAGLESHEFSTVVESTVPLVVDRTMTWGPNHNAGHAETSIAEPAATWFLAEGATHSGFDLFYTIQNPNALDATVTVRYLRPDGAAPLEKTYTAPKESRFNIWVDLEEFPDGSGSRLLASTDVSSQITSDRPIIVERSMYLSTAAQRFRAGTNSAGVTAPATSWFLAEGTTAAPFDLFVLVANPSPAEARVRGTYLLPDGATLTKDYTVPPNSRFNIWVDLEQFPDGSGNRALAATPVSTTMTSLDGVPIVVERAMWWPEGAWTEAHNSAGSTATGLLWAVAEGEEGGSANTRTYLTIANTSDYEGRAKVTLLFDDGTPPAETTIALPAQSRTTVWPPFDLGGSFPAGAHRRFGAVVESIGATPARIVVERPMYWDANGVWWAAGTNAMGTRLQ